MTMDLLGGPPVDPNLPTYSLMVKCSNCGAGETQVFVPKGTRLKTYLKREKCSFCGCEGTLVKRRESQ